MTWDETRKLLDTFPGNYRGDWCKDIYDVSATCSQNGRVLEIGAQLGTSAFTIACAIKEKGGMVYSLEPGFYTPRYYKWPEAWNPFKDVIHSEVDYVMGQFFNYKLHGILVPLPGTSIEVLPEWDGRLFDAIIIDGDHTYNSVSLDVQWAKYTTPNATMLFDDWIQPVEKAAMEFFNQHHEWRRIKQNVFKKG
jgi:hypothetical protein